MFEVHVLPAHRGDCFWIEYGPPEEPRRMLVDGGLTKSGREALRAMIDSRSKPLDFELLVITHIDLDHIEGIIEILNDLPQDVRFKEIWFNGWDQLKLAGLEPLGVKAGIALTKLLEEKHMAAWNKSTGGKAVALDETDKVTRHQFDGGMAVAVLSPGRSQLAKLRDRWREAVEELSRKVQEKAVVPPGLEALGPIDVLKLAESTFQEDDSVTNGSSIALCLEHEGRRLLLLADAHPSVIERSIKQLSPTARLHAAAVKLSHHGSRRNTSLSLIRSIDARTWIVSTDGTGGTKHPNREAIARVLYGKSAAATLVFNYKTEFNDVWENRNLKRTYSYETIFGDGKGPILIRLPE
ncbi:hypothetical protein ACVWZ6_001634 [Bradyrhizobium sp. GM6.1]